MTDTYKLFLYLLLDYKAMILHEKGEKIEGTPIGDALNRLWAEIPQELKNIVIASREVNPSESSKQTAVIIGFIKLLEQGHLPPIIEQDEIWVGVLHEHVPLSPEYPHLYTKVVKG